MLDISVDHVQIVQEYVVNKPKSFQSSNESLYHMSEVDLSFCDALAGMCSGEASSGPVNRPTSNVAKKTTV